VSGLIVLTEAQAQRFWAKVRQPEMPHHCWEWTASTRGWANRRKYGQFRVGDRIFYAHRIAYCAVRGWPLDYLTDNLAVLHACDNPLCCSPHHLSIGTQLENVIDMIRKGRHRSGPRRKKLRADQEIPV